MASITAVFTNSSLAPNAALYFLLLQWLWSTGRYFEEVSRLCCRPTKFADHSDNILEVQQRNLTISPVYIAYMRWDFDASLTLAERQQRADKLLDMFNSGFGGCNLYHHTWGGEMAYYMACGYTDYSDFGKKFNAVNTVLAEQFMNAKLDIRTHPDELLIRVME